MKYINTVLIILLCLFTLNCNKNFNTSLKGTDMNVKLYILEKNSVLKYYDLKTKISEEISLPKEYEYYDLAMRDENNFYFSFLNNDHEGIVNYKISNNTINKIFTTSKRYIVHFYLSIEYNGKGVYYNTIENAMYNCYYLNFESGESIKIVEDKDPVQVLALNYINNFVLVKKNKVEVYEKLSSKLFELKNHHSIVYNPIEKKYFSSKFSNIYIYDSNSNIITPLEIKIKKDTVVKLVNFDKTGRYLFFECIGYGENYYLKVIDLKEKKIFPIDIPITKDAYMLFFN